jgi:hypothetical protein
MLANPEIIKKYIGNKPVTCERKKDGVLIIEYGKLNMESFIKSLLECPQITKQGL